MDRRELTPRYSARHVVHDRVARGSHHWVGIELHAIELNTRRRSWMTAMPGGSECSATRAAFGGNTITDRSDRW
ncbi:hypothetical protein [Bradyrhizobium quebecense]|uniref:Uncharacterized protein n=2 Tax=Bradyrhizobium quebecense TaxID=2748629 RepID=A0ACD3VI21_9BRAD|nr:hypothetical protein [Bradyrhizobium quebecense]UGY06157.1 hypothetical protein J4P68_0016095 [Bradyrhizobium quebecense]